MINIKGFSNKTTNRPFVFSDLDPSFSAQSISKNIKNNDVVAGSDINAAFDETAIRNAIKNIFLQRRYLNPKFNINLIRYIGQPLSETGALSLGTEIERGIALNEPRVRVQKIIVAPDYTNLLYYIRISLLLPNLSNKNLILSGAFRQTGDFFYLDK